MGQKERIIEYMNQHGSISSMEAMRELGVMRLGARIFEIAEDYEVIRETEVAKNRFGEKTYYTRYRLGGKYKEECQTQNSIG